MQLTTTTIINYIQDDNRHSPNQKLYRYFEQDISINLCNRMRLAAYISFKISNSSGGGVGRMITPSSEK